MLGRQDQSRLWHPGVAIGLVLLVLACATTRDRVSCTEWLAQSPVTPTTRTSAGWQVLEYEMLVDGRLHEPAVGPEGSVWFTDQLHGCIGALDPVTGVVKVVAAMTPQANLHGLAIDTGGTVWYATGTAARIGRLNLRTSTHDDFILSPAVKDVHTVVVRAGQIWFTAPSSNRFGRLDAVTGQVMTLWDGSMAYGLTKGLDGSMWVALAATDSLVQIRLDDTRRAWPLPTSAARPRHLVTDSRGSVWYNDRDRSMLGRLVPGTGTTEEFRTFSRDAFPTGLAADGSGRIWYYEVRTGLLIGMTPDTDEHVSIQFELEGGGVNQLVFDAHRKQLWLASDYMLTAIVENR